MQSICPQPCSIFLSKFRHPQSHHNYTAPGKAVATSQPINSLFNLSWSELGSCHSAFWRHKDPEASRKAESNEMMLRESGRAMLLWGLRFWLHMLRMGVGEPRWDTAADKAKGSYGWHWSRWGGRAGLLDSPNGTGTTHESGGTDLLISQSLPFTAGWCTSLSFPMQAAMRETLESGALGCNPQWGGSHLRIKMATT